VAWSRGRRGGGGAEGLGEGREINRRVVCYSEHLLQGAGVVELVNQATVSQDVLVGKERPQSRERKYPIVRARVREEEGSMKKGSGSAYFGNAHDPD
jgi:hypothetical protein